MNSRVARPLFVPMGARQRHDGGRARVDQITRNVQIGIHIRHDNKAFVCENLGRADSLLIVRQQVLAVAHDFDLDEIAAAARTRQTRNANCLVGIAGTRGVRQQRYAFRNIVEDVSRAALILRGAAPA